jgi:dihydrolipoamide dehydrogenase
MAEGRSIVIIGAGPGGYVAAIRAAQLGGRVTLIEAQEVGGTCLNQGCIPSKALIYDVEVMDLIRRAAEFGIEIQGEPRFNPERMIERKRKVVETQVRGIHSLLKSWGVRYMKGRGRLLDGRTVAVAGPDGTEERLSAGRIILATGSIPIKPDLFPFDGEKIITSEEALMLKSIPARLLIIGAGVEGCEFAFLYRGLGSDVTLVEMKPRALHTEDEEISAMVEREMNKRAIKLHAGVRVEKVERRGPELVAVLSDGREIASDQILVSIGRRMSTDGLGLDRAGVSVGARGEVIVNERMETNTPGIYAIGDLVARMMLAHVASAEGKIAAHNAVGAGDPKAMDYRVVPAGIFTQPEIGTVGLKDWEAAKQGLKIKVGRFLFRALGRAHTLGEITGVIKVITDAATRQILGVHIIGPHASDLIHEAALAMRLGATSEDLAHLIHAHPTLMEGIMEAAEDVRGMSIHTLKKPGA